MVDHRLFKAIRGLRQGDTFSPLLFIVTMEALNMLMLRAKEEGLLRGLRVEVEEQMEITFLFFVDDTLVFCKLDENALLNLRYVLLCLQAVSGLQINLSKSEFMRLGEGTIAE